MDDFRRQLDELMGRERDLPLDERRTQRVEFNDPQVCKYELVGVCPNRLFVNTRSALGTPWTMKP